MPANVKLLELSPPMAIAVHLKEGAVKRAKKEQEGWLPPVAMLLDERGEVLLAIVAPQCDEQLGLRAARALRIGWAATRVVVSLDAFFARQDPKARPPVPGEYQERFLAGASRNDDGIGSKLLFLEYLEGGQVRSRGLPYQATAGRRVHWLDPGDDASAKFREAGGRMVEALKEMMSVVPMREMPEVIEAARTHEIADDQIHSVPIKVTKDRLESEGFTVIEFTD